MSDNNRAVRSGLKRYWRRKSLEHAVGDLRKTSLKDLVKDAPDERTFWSEIIRGDRALFDAAEMLQNPTTKGYAERCAVAVLRGFVVSVGNSSFIETALRAQIRREANQLEQPWRDDILDPYDKLIYQARARLSRRNIRFYTGAYFAFGDPDQTLPAQTGDQLEKVFRKNLAWTMEGVIMLAGLHAYATKVDPHVFEANARAERAFKLPSKMTWRPLLPLIEPNVKVRKKKSIENDLAKPSVTDAFAFAYALHSIEAEDGRHLLTVLLDKACTASDLSRHLPSAFSRARHVLDCCMPSSQRKKCSERWNGFSPEPFSSVEQVWEMDAEEIQTLMQTPIGRKPQK